MGGNIPKLIQCNMVENLRYHKYRKQNHCPRLLMLLHGKFGCQQGVLIRWFSLVATAWLVSKKVSYLGMSLPADWICFYLIKKFLL